MSYLEDSLRRRLIFFTGKGGVGKSSLTWATAFLCHQQGKKVAVVSWSPFDKETQSPPTTDIDWIRIETLSAFREYALQIIKFDKIFDVVFDNHVFKTFVRAAPGLPETVAAGKLWDLYRQDIYDVILVDLPSSGHAVSFFESPQGINKLFRTGFIHKDSEKILEMFQDEGTRIDLVTLPEELPVAECRQLKQELEQVLPFHLGYLHFNQCVPELELSSQLPQGLSEDVKNCLDRHLKYKQEDATNFSEAKALGLPTLRIERLAEELPENIIREISNTLEAH